MPSKLKKPKLKSLDDLFGGTASERIEIEINELEDYRGHPFNLGTEEGLLDLTSSIQSNGVIMPIIVRAVQGRDKYEILAGHRRTEASRRANKSKIPAIILRDVSDEEAIAIVVETNLMQRSFSDMLHSEKALVIGLHYSKMFSQGKRSDIRAKLLELDQSQKVNERETLSQVGTKLRSDEKVGEMYSLSRNTIARYLRINKLNDSLKGLLDQQKISFIPAVQVSFLTESEQSLLAELLQNGFTLDMKKANKLREMSKEKPLDQDNMSFVLSGKALKTVKTTKKISMSSETYLKYFTEEQSTKEVESMVEQALELYFDKVSVHRKG